MDKSAKKVSKPWHWILEDLTLTEHQKIVALVLLKHANGSGASWPTQDRIAKMAGISKRLTVNVLQQLKAKNIAAEVGRTGNTGKVAVWKVRQLQPSMFTSRSILDRKSFTDERIVHQEIVHQEIVHQVHDSIEGNSAPGAHKDVHRTFEDVKPREPVQPFLLEPPPIDWLPLDAWAGFRKMRERVKKPLTEYAVEMTLRKLRELKDQGEDPREVLEQSILHCWAGVFRVKKTEEFNGNKEQARHERSQQAIANVLGHRSGLADRLRESVQGGSDRGARPGLPARARED
jgi:hypothetical protein